MKNVGILSDTVSQFKCYRLAGGRRAVRAVMEFMTTLDPFLLELRFEISMEYGIGLHVAYKVRDPRSLCGTTREFVSALLDFNSKTERNH